MGLDMYLHKTNYVRNWPRQMRPDELHEVTVTRGGEPTLIRPERVTYVLELVAYWRKAYVIHRWFVENVQGGIDNCAEYLVHASQLRQLLSLLKEGLPDEEDTIAKLTAVLAEEGADGAEYSYRASH